MPRWLPTEREEFLDLLLLTQKWRLSGSTPPTCNSKFGHKIKDAGKIRPPVCSSLLISHVFYYFNSLQHPERLLKYQLSDEITGGLRALTFSHKVMLQGK